MIFDYTQTDLDDVLKTCFTSVDPLRLKVFPAKEKRKFLCLVIIIGQIGKDRVYREKEINALLEPIYPDYATLRRYLVDYGFLSRKTDGSEYRALEGVL